MGSPGAKLRSPGHQDPEHGAKGDAAGEITQHQTPRPEPLERQDDAHPAAHDGVGKLRSRPRAKIDALLCKCIVRGGQRPEEKAQAQHREQRDELWLIEEECGKRPERRRQESETGSKPHGPDEGRLRLLELFLPSDHECLRDPEVRERLEKGDEYQRQRDQAELLGRKQARENSRCDKRQQPTAYIGPVCPDHPPERPSSDVRQG